MYSDETSITPSSMEGVKIALHAVYCLSKCQTLIALTTSDTRARKPTCIHNDLLQLYTPSDAIRARTIEFVQNLSQATRVDCCTAEDHL